MRVGTLWTWEDPENRLLKEAPTTYPLRSFREKDFRFQGLGLRVRRCLGFQDRGYLKLSLRLRVFLDPLLQHKDQNSGNKANLNRAFWVHVCVVGGSIRGRICF